jgi:hypothetical protein
MNPASSSDLAGTPQREIYFRRLRPVLGEFGYTRPRNDGSPYTAAMVSVYDDLALENVIKVQFRQSIQPNPKVAVFTFDSAAGLKELIDDLSAAHAVIAGVPTPSADAKPSTDPSADADAKAAPVLPKL